jgi:hypothetical protein
LAVSFRKLGLFSSPGQCLDLCKFGMTHPVAFLLRVQFHGTVYNTALVEHEIL